MSMTPASVLALTAVLAGLLGAPIPASAAEPSGRGMLIVTGATDRGPEVRLAPSDLEAAGVTAIVTATPWSVPASRFEGPRLDALLTALGARGGEVVLSALDGYSVTLPRGLLERYGAILAMRQDGRPLSVRDRGPYWLMFPFDDHAELRNDRHYYQAIWQVNRIEVR
ncbi:hypothetical protein HL658_01020 [Azospirillum sp. RWY-5-1]|uniref:Oxidoreductase n=1 Tax=Azospirillum oleiclasticum TaxID=2735135 RepID=A0ABX2T4R0_9PROT|nr:hypothetical protein [Azospirillum oleiclasticum]NYZ11115.1 hypothetical protein [Azospirillum oleiclasticum]NYZ18277.1 hypothetical protein [Azospirillum oleiclasticum]